MSSAFNIASETLSITKPSVWSWLLPDRAVCPGSAESLCLCHYNSLHEHKQQVAQTHIVSVEQLIGQNQVGMGSSPRPTELRKEQKKSIFAPIMVGLLSLSNYLPSDQKLMFIGAKAKSGVQEVHPIN